MNATIDYKVEIDDAELFTRSVKLYHVKNIKTRETSFLPLMVSKSVEDNMRILEAQGWVFYVVDQTRGRCYYQPRIITIPLWATKKSKDYLDWYVSHEIAHTYARGDNHGQKFMSELKRLCPEDSIHYEITYKPRNAIAAGISHKISALESPTKRTLLEILRDKKGGK